MTTSLELDVLEDMVRQFAYETTVEGVPSYTTGGLFALEYAFDVLGWSDPHPMNDPRPMETDRARRKIRAELRRCGAGWDVMVAADDLSRWGWRDGEVVTTCITE